VNGEIRGINGKCVDGRGASVENGSPVRLSLDGPAAEPARRSPRAQRDAIQQTAIRRVWDTHFAVLRRAEGVATAPAGRSRRGALYDTVAHAPHGLARARRGRAWVTTTQSAVAADHPQDLVARDFTASRPNQLWVADFTYVATWSGFVYVAFVIDAFACRIVGWRVSASLQTDFVLDA